MSRKAIYIVGGVIVALVVIAAILPLFIDANNFKPQIESAANDALGRKVTMGNISLSLLSGGVSVKDVAVSEDPQYGSGSFLTAKSVAVGVEMLPLIFSKQLHVTHVTIDEPDMTLLRGASGTWNFSSLGAKNAPSSSSSSAGNFSVGKIEIKSGKLMVGSTAPGAKLREYDNVDLTASDVSPTTQFPFEFSAATPGNGSIKLSGKAGPLNSTDSAATPLDASLKIQNVDLTTTGFVDPSSGIAGTLDFDGNVSSNGQTADAKGTITANKLKLVPGGAPAGEPVQLNYEVNYDLKSQTGSLKQGDVHVGKAVVTLSGTFNNAGASPTVSMKLNGMNMPATDLQAMLPAVGAALPSGASFKSGTMDADLAVTGPIDKLVTTGPVKLSNATLAGFNLGEKLGSLSSFAGIPKGTDTQIQDFSSNLRIAPEGIRADNINLVAPPIGSITGSGTVSADNKLNFDMVAHLSASNGAAGALTGVASIVGGSKSEGGIPFKIEGTTSQPSFYPNLGAVAGNLGKGLEGSVPAAGKGLGKLGGLIP